MRIYDSKHKRELNEITIYLTPDEASELASYALHISEHPEAHHVHFSDADFSREIIVAVYTPENINQFDNTSKEIIGDDWKRSSLGPRRLVESRTIAFTNDSPSGDQNQS